MQNVDATHETVPSHPAGASTVTGDVKLISGQTLPIADTLLVPPGPETLIVSVYLCAVALASAGNAIGTETLADVAPAAQAVVTGNPTTAGVAETVHFVERLTIAERAVAPPAEGRSEGCRTTLVTDGGASRTTTVTGLAFAVPPAPVTVSPNLYAF